MTKKNDENILMIASSEADANLYYATRFIAPDDIIFFQIHGKKHLLLSDLEVDRARSQAGVDQVHSLSKLAGDFKKQHPQRPSLLDLVETFAKEHKASALTVPGNFQVQYADALRKRGLKIEVRPDPFWPQRMLKTKEEVAAVKKAIRHTENAIRAATSVLRKSVIKKGRLYDHGKVLTSEDIKKVINVSLMENDCVAQHSIVACGLDCVDPHHQGSGPLYANESIIMDIFPRHSKNRYHADITRTVVRGKAKPKLKKMFEAVIEGQKIAFRSICEGADGNVIHAAIEKRFQALGFTSGLMNRRMQGFFHGTGHGLGLDVHEAPRIGRAKDILKAGQIVTVEPGLYYEDAGGIRIEDDVLVTKNGCTILSTLERKLEL